MAEARRTGARILPVDANTVPFSNAGSLQATAMIWQMPCHFRHQPYLPDRLGGPFRDRDLSSLPKYAGTSRAPPQLGHGTKDFHDSATMMNKGLEVIEAAWLFDLQPTRLMS